MANENEQVNRVIFEADEASKAKLLKAYNDLSKAQERVAKDGLRAGDSFEVVAKESRNLAKQQGDVITTMRALDKEWANQVTGAKEATESLDDYQARLKQIKEGGADLSGDIASSLGGIRGAAGAVGLGGVTDAPLGIAQAFADVGEFAPKLKVQLGSLAEGLKASGGGVGNFAGELAALASGALPTTAAGMGALALGVGAVAIAAAPLIIAAGLLANELDKNAKAAAEYEKSLAAARHEVNQAVESGGTTSEFANRITELGATVRASAKDIEEAQAAYDAYTSGRNPLQALGDGLNIVGDREAALEQAIIDANKAYQDAIITQSEYNEAIKNGETAAADIAAQEEELAKVRAQDAADAIAQQQQALARISQLETQQSTLLQNRAQAEQNASELEAFDRRVANEDELAETQAHLDDLAAIQAAGNDKIKALNQEITNVGLDLIKAVGEIQTKGTAELGKSQTEYFKNSIKANEDYQRELARSNTEFAKNQKRLAEDINKSLNDAYRENDVIAFLKAQEEGNTQLKRNAEDAKDAEKQKAEDFTRSQEEQRAAFQDRQAQILQGIEDEKQKAIQAANERRAAIVAQIEQEKVATQQAIANANTRYQQSEALEAQQLKRTTERQAIITAQQDAAFQRQIANIQSEISAQNSLYATISAGISRIQSQASALGASRSSANSSYTNPSYDSPYVRGGGAFGGRGSSNTTVNINNTVGDIATGKTVSAAMEQVFGALGAVFQGSS